MVTWLLTCYSNTYVTQLFFIPISGLLKYQDILGSLQSNAFYLALKLSCFDILYLYIHLLYSVLKDIFTSSVSYGVLIFALFHIIYISWFPMLFPPGRGLLASLMLFKGLFCLVSVHEYVPRQENNRKMIIVLKHKFQERKS